MKRPKCRYTGKECPEKPYYIRQEYPFGTPIGYNEDGCMHWHIEIMLNLETKKDLILQGCIDMFNAFYMRDYGIRSLGNQKATEQLRNGLCQEIEKETPDGKKIKSYIPKPSSETIVLLKLFKQISDKMLLMDNNNRGNLIEDN
ncbi:MAG: hypothetical protein ACFFG0_04575 [Candidatus Thorarchaeota archaeon]